MRSEAPYPVQYSVDYPDRPLNRLTTFFRVFMVLPIAIVLALIEGGGYAYGGAPGPSVPPVWSCCPRCC
jgi:hypothetical protein